MQQPQKNYIMKNLIEFSENGKSFVIKFANGKESMDIESKREGFKAIAKLAQNQKISIDEFNEMRKQITEAENLPVEVKTEEDDFLDDLNDIVSLLAIMEMLHEFSPRPKEPVEEAYFHICEECKKHGVIYGRDFRTGQITSKKEAFIYLDALKKRENITEAEYLKVKAEVEASSLSEE